MLFLAGWLVWSKALTECDKAGNADTGPIFSPVFALPLDNGVLVP